MTCAWTFLARRCAEVLKPRQACLQTSLHFDLLTFGYFTILRVSDDRVPSRLVQSHVLLWRRVNLRATYLDRMTFNDILMSRIWLSVALTVKCQSPVVLRTSRCFFLGVRSLLILCSRCPAASPSGLGGHRCFSLWLLFLLKCPRPAPRPKHKTPSCVRASTALKMSIAV